MEVLPESLDPHSAEREVGWQDRALEHALWFLSRGLLIALIVGIAFYTRIPFQRLLQRDVALEMEEIEKEKMLSEFKAINSLSVAAAKFQPSIDDVFATFRVPNYEGEKRLDNKVYVKLHRAEDALTSLRDVYATRQVALDEQLQVAIEHLIQDGEDILTRCEVLSSDTESIDRSVTFRADKILIANDIAEITGYEQTYASGGKHAVESNK